MIHSIPFKIRGLFNTLTLILCPGLQSAQIGRGDSSKSLLPGADTFAPILWARHRRPVQYPKPQVRCGFRNGLGLACGSRPSSAKGPYKAVGAGVWQASAGFFPHMWINSIPAHGRPRDNLSFLLRRCVTESWHGRCNEHAWHRHHFPRGSA